MEKDYSKRAELKAKISELQRELHELEDGRQLDFSKFDDFKKVEIHTEEVKQFLRKLVVSLYCFEKEERTYNGKVESYYYCYRSKKVGYLMPIQIANCNKCLSELIGVYLKYLNGSLN